MKLHRDEMIVWWRTKTGPATFTARKGPDIRHSPSLAVYPLKSGRGFLWLIWHGKFGLEAIEKNIKTGGTTARDYERACKLAVHELLVYKGRPNA